MNRWEYKALTIASDDGCDGYAMEQMLNGLGKHGWELGCCMHNGAAHTFIFKRRVQR